MQKSIYLIGLLCLAGTVFAADPQQGTDPLNGTWKISLAKSKYSPGPPPTSGTRTYEITGDTLKVTNKGVNAEGKTTSTDFTAKFDGKEYPESGNPDFDRISLKRTDAFTVDSVQKRDGKVATTNHTTVSKDGKVLTFTTKGTNAKGQPVNNVVVFDKQ
jgi:hypothetical protein